MLLSYVVCSCLHSTSIQVLSPLRDLNKKASLVKGLLRNPLVMILKAGDYLRECMKTPIPSTLHKEYRII